MTVRGRSICCTGGVGQGGRRGTPGYKRIANYGKLFKNWCWFVHYCLTGTIRSSMAFAYIKQIRLRVLVPLGLVRALSFSLGKIISVKFQKS